MTFVISQYSYRSFESVIYQSYGLNWNSVVWRSFKTKLLSFWWALNLFFPVTLGRILNKMSDIKHKRNKVIFRQTKEKFSEPHLVRRITEFSAKYTIRAFKKPFIFLKDFLRMLYEQGISLIFYPLHCEHIIMYVIFDNLKVEIFHQGPDLNHTFSDWFETRQFDLVRSKTDWPIFLSPLRIVIVFQNI